MSVTYSLMNSCGLMCSEVFANYWYPVQRIIAFPVQSNTYEIKQTNGSGMLFVACMDIPYSESLLNCHFQILRVSCVESTFAGKTGDLEPPQSFQPFFDSGRCLLLGLILHRYHWYSLQPERQDIVI